MVPLGFVSLSPFIAILVATIFSVEFKQSQVDELSIVTGVELNKHEIDLWFISKCAQNSCGFTLVPFKNCASRNWDRRITASLKSKDDCLENGKFPFDKNTYFNMCSSRKET